MNEESNEQIKVVNWCKTRKILCFSIPNGSHLAGSAAQRARKMHFLKQEGLHVGASDLVVMTNNKILFIEMKRKREVLKSGELSTAGIGVSEFQLKFMEQVKEFDYAVATIAYGHREAISFIEKYK